MTDPSSISFTPDRVANSFPASPHPTHRIAIIGDAPGAEEVQMNAPFTGPSGGLLWALAARNQIARAQTFIGNICQQRPPGNDIKRFAWSGPEIQSGLRQLTEDLNEYNPNVCLLLGAAPLRAAGIDISVTSFRGSVFVCNLLNSPFYNRKCVSSLHPSYCLRDRSSAPLLGFDLKKTFREGDSPHYTATPRTLDIDLGPFEAIERIQSIPQHSTIAFDIEGDHEHISCLSIATSPLYAFIIAFERYSIDEQALVLRALRSMFDRTDLTFVIQNALYDPFCLATHGLPIFHNIEDTMLTSAEIYCELKRGLDTQVSIWTDHPYYKSDRTSPDRATFYRYCCTDSALTLECFENQIRVMNDEQKAHYEFMRDLLPAFNFIQMRGIKYDTERANERLAAVQGPLKSLLMRLRTRSNNPDFNPNSPQQVSNFLYGQMGLPPIYKKEGGRKTNKLTTDQKALTSMMLKFPDKPAVAEIYEYKRLYKSQQYIKLKTDPDGRVRCRYNIVGAETLRVTCSTSITGSGTNMTTVPKAERVSLIADEGYTMAAIDLEGADGLTVAGRCAMLGFGVMLDDYIMNLKPALFIMAAYKYPDIWRESPEKILSVANELKSDKSNAWLYFACKRVQHGTNYGLGLDTMMSQIVNDSAKYLGYTIGIDRVACKALQNIYATRRYGCVLAWQNWVKQQLFMNKKLKAACGHTRTFFGDTRDHATYRSALAHEPQINTTFATHQALYNLWHDSSNRRADGSLIIEPLHEIHDELLTQFPTDTLAKSLGLIQLWFRTKLTFGNVDVDIPFSGGYGPSWGECETSIFEVA